MIKPEKQKKLEQGGWVIADTADFLELSDEERQLLDARVELAMAIRRQRASSNLSQKQLGAKLCTSQPRVAKIERAAADVSLDQLFRAFTAAGGTIEVCSVAAKKSKKGQTTKSPPQKVILRVTNS